MEHLKEVLEFAWREGGGDVVRETSLCISSLDCLLCRMLWPQFVFANHLVLTYLLVSYPRKSGVIGNGNHLRPIHLNYELGPQPDHDWVAVLIITTFIDLK